MDADSVFDSLASSVRRDILAYLSTRDESSAGEIADAIEEVGRTAVSTHLRILRSTGLIRERKAGRMRLYSLDREGPAMIAVGYFQTLMQATLQDLGRTAGGDQPALPTEHALPKTG
jgi:Predicted transcriptional regulators